MTDEQSSEVDMNKILWEMMQQMTRLQEKVDALQKNPQADSRQDSEEEAEDGMGGLVQFMEMTKTQTKTFLEAAFSSTMANANRKKGVRRIGLQDCDQIRCPKLDGVLKAVLPKDAIKADGYLSRLQHFWLDVL